MVVGRLADFPPLPSHTGIAAARSHPRRRSSGAFIYFACLDASATAGSRA
jgi:hypothetical protein